MCRGLWSRRLTSALAVALLVCGARGATAAVTASGEINPSSVVPNNPGVDLEIGVGTQPYNVDPRATVTVNAASTLNYDEILVGYDDGFFGRLIASGDGTVVQVQHAGDSRAGLVVGRDGNGYASFTDGVTFRTANSNGDVSIGESVGSVGELLIDGALTFFDVEEDFRVGQAGAGGLTISGGALVRTTETDSQFIVGDLATSSGYATVDGAQTVLQLGDDLTVGRLGVGEMHISDGALVQSYNHLTNSPQATVGTLGKITLAGGVLDFPDTNVDGQFGGYGIVRGQVDVSATGVVEVGPGEVMNVEGAFNNSGAVTLTDGELRLLGTATTTAGGRYTLEDGVLRFSQAHTNDGVIASAAGTSNIHGAITNNGSVIVASETVAVFNDAFSGGGTLDVLARGNAIFLGSATFVASSQIALCIAASDGVIEPAQIQVAGEATLAGELMVDLPAGYSPSSNQSIQLIYAAGGLTVDEENFVPPVFPSIEGLVFDLLQTPTSLLLDVQLSSTAILDGDFNGDNVVDAADYAVWRNGYGTQYFDSDYIAWRENFGKSLSPVAPSPATAPEPAALACLLVSACLLAARRR